MCFNSLLYPQQIGITGVSVSQALGIADKLEVLHAICNGSDKYEYYDILADDWDIESRCHIAFDAWGLRNIELTTPIDSLSGGEKTKLFLAGIAIHHSEIILLDEPTNHLDYSSHQKLYEFIRNCKATVIAVSHDITLLNLLEDTYELSPKGLKLYGGNYDFYKIQKDIEEQALKQQIDAEKNTLKLVRKKAKEVNERQEKRSRQGEKNKDQVPRSMRQLLKNSGENTGAKLKDKHTEIINQSRQKLAELIKNQNAICELKLDFDNALLHNGKILISAHGINFKYEGSELLWQKPLDFEIQSGERIHLIGDNGTDKTTLLKLLNGELLPSVGEIVKADFSFVYLDQEYSKIKASDTVLELALKYNYDNLLEHEDLERMEKGIYTEGFFNLTDDNIYKSTVIKDIDTNIGQLLKTDAKFYAIHVNPSEKELRAMGNTEQEQAEAMKHYIREVFVPEYAKNFNKKLSEADIRFYGKIHFDRSRSNNELNMHCHSIISRKDQANKKKLSPLTNHKNTKNGVIKGGFNRVNLFQQVEQGFDKLFGYNRQELESFDYRNTMKNSSISDQLRQQEQELQSNDRKIGINQKNLLLTNLETLEARNQTLNTDTYITTNQKINNSDKQSSHQTNSQLFNSSISFFSTKSDLLSSSSISEEEKAKYKKRRKYKRR